MKKYCLHPGYVISKNDGEKHYITYQQLVGLYKLDPKECVEWFDYIFDSYEDFKHLGPRHDGNYEAFIKQKIMNG